MNLMLIYFKRDKKTLLKKSHQCVKNTQKERRKYEIPKGGKYTNKI